MAEQANQEKQENQKEQEEEQKSKEQENSVQEKPKKDSVIKIKESEHQKLLDEAAEFKDKYLRLYAEFDNARKRMQREKQDFIKYANESLLTDFLTILDSLELSVKAAREDHEDKEALLKGVELVLGQMFDLLKRNGVKPIEAQNTKFDPNRHEVLMQEESEDVEENTVLEEFQKGYSFHDAVIRTAKVKLAKSKEQ